MGKFKKTRVAEDAGTPGKWVAQYYDADMRLWFDIGDARNTRAQAEAHLATEVAADKYPLHPDIARQDADSVTHFICPDGPTRDGVPDATHHLMPRRAAGTVGGRSRQENVCSYCGLTETQLRAILPLAGK